MNLEDFKGERVYLACPYSYPNESIRNLRYRRNLAATVALVTANIFVFSPIVYCHEQARLFGLPRDFDFWKAFDWSWIEWADHFWIDAQRGWEESEGIQHELVFADAQNKPVLLYYNEDQTLEEIG